ncbi:MAG: molecular chaperone GrpE [Parcubacteria group bacterium LiPW_41]|nr:MAG: molecular chaperone GrpE [Parcubacteria group bacterium LiPW_41]
MEEEKKEITEKELDIETIQKERNEYLEGWKRAKADFINYKNEETERTKRFSAITKEMIVADILPVLDSFELGIMSSKDEQSKKGMELIRMQLEEVLRRNGLEKINASPGDQFNPLYHEAIGEKESEYAEGTIAEEVGIGYTLDGRIVRPTRVKISKESKK